MRFLLVILISFLQSVDVPYSFNFRSNLDLRSSYDIGLSSNEIIDFEAFSDSIIFMGTTNGLNIGFYNETGEINYGNFSSNDNMVEGSNPALTIKNSVIAVSGAESVETSLGPKPKGLGVSYSTNGGESWEFISQPTDDMDQWGCPWSEDNILYSNEDECDNICVDCLGESKDCVMYNYISWGEQDFIRNLSVTTDIQNVSYDLAILGNYIYAASWAGSLRRFDYTDDDPIWEVVPLPMDNQTILNCGDIDLSFYQINPVGNYINSQTVEDCGYDFDNHKVFSVHSIEDTLWVGTASGINKGILNDDNCIDWERMTSENYGFYDDWIIGFEHEVLEDESIRLWAITWDRRYDGSYLVYGGPPSYTDDGGESWHIVENLADRQVITYNISPHSNGVYVSSNEGLFISENTILWEKIIQDEEYTILTEAVMDAELIESFNNLWIGSNPLEIRDLNSGGSNAASSEGNVNLKFYAYPNPIIGNEVSRFVYDGDEQNINGTITIYDFSMDKVIQIKSTGSSIWDGRNEYGTRVANGVYFCHYKHSNNSSYVFNIMVINK